MKHPHLKSQSGVALVVVLSLIVLVTIAAMAFFARATSNRVIEASRAGQALGGQVARTAEDYVLAQLIADLNENATKSSTGSVTIYFPTNGLASMPPRRFVDSSLTNNTNFANLAQQSGAGVSSSHPTTDRARNGRAIPPERWNAPRLLFGSSFATNSAPRWIYVMKNGTASSTVTPASAPDVIGRFAYNIYNVSGLLDANLAGHPGLSGTNLAAIKGTLSGADLTALPGVTTGALEELIAFRNPQATDASDYRNYATNAANENYRSPVVGSTTNNLFHSREDLIRYATRQNASLTNALPYLTHASPAANRPIVKVDGDGDGSPDPLPVRRPSSATITRYRDNGTSYTVGVKAGEPLLDQRYSLAKLAWLGPDGPAAGASAASVQACFGLVWNSSDALWVYTGPSGSTPVSEIDSLAKVAAQNRDPNFFELLNAGVGFESLDLAVNTIRKYQDLVTDHKAYSGGKGFEIDRTPNYQVLTIAANIIDQADKDNYPTRIRFDDFAFYGTEDLPQISAIYAKVFYKFNGQSPKNQIPKFGGPPVSLYLIPQLWNPHRQSSYVVSQSPTEIMLTFEDGSVVWEIGTQAFDPATGERKPGSPTPPTLPFDVTLDGENVVIGSVLSGQDFTSSGQDFRATPNVIKPGPGISGELAGGITPFTTSDDYFPTVGLELGRYEGPSWPAGFTVTGETAAPYTAVWTKKSNGDYNSFGPRVSIQSFSNVMVTLSYRAADGNFRKYATFLGKPELSTTGLNGIKESSGPALNAADLYNNSRKDVGATAIRKVDPRTDRFGAFATKVNPSSAEMTLPAPPNLWDNTKDYFSKANYVYAQGFQTLAGPDGYTQECPDLFTLLAGGLYPVQKTWQNTQTGAIYSDADGVSRPADGYLAATNAHPMYQTGTGAAGNSTSADRVRPIILQRPFHSVAELGYVFRDQPWKTLDFFSDKSADKALLDLFCVSESTGGGAVGKVNANSAPTAVLDSLLRSEPYDDMDARYPSSAGSISTNVSKTLAEDVRNELAANAAGDRSGFPALVASNKLAPSVSTNTPTTYAKPSREAGLRALNDLTEFSTWRVQADIIAQSGRFPPQKSGSGDFLIEGEERVWSTLAMDRITGDVLFSQTEHPSE